MKWYYVLILIASLVSIAVVYIVQSGQYLNKRSNGFTRIQSKSRIVYVGSHHFEEEMNSISQGLDSMIYILGSDLSVVPSLNLKTNEITILQTQIPKNVKIRIGSWFFSDVYNGKLYIFAFNLRKVYKIDLRSKILDSIWKPGSLFLRALPIDDSVIAIREYNNLQKDCEFATWSTANGLLNIKAQPMRIYHDGGITTDGQLYYDSKDGTLIYMGYYYNTVYVFDTVFNLIRAFSTIDTTKNPKISVRDNHGHISVNGPAFIINACLYKENDKIGVCSRLKADNESPNLFSKNVIIDTYDYKSGKYLYSDYLPKHHIRNVSNIIKAGPVIILQSDNYVDIYTIND